MSQIAFGLQRDGYVVPSMVRGMASEVRQAAGAMWAYKGEDWRVGWQRCRKDRFSIVKVRIAIERGAA